MFKITKHTAAIVLAIMLVTQIGLAQHSSVHFTDHEHYTHSHSTHDHHDRKENKHNTHENCPVCVSIKSLSHGLTVESTDLQSHIVSKHRFVKKHIDAVSHLRYESYNPRAPPAFLI